MLANDSNYFDRTLPHVIMLFIEEDVDAMEAALAESTCVVHAVSTVMEAVGSYLRLVRARIVPRAVIADFDVHRTEAIPQRSKNFKLTKNTLYLFEQCYFLDTHIDQKQSGSFLLYTDDVEAAEEAYRAYPDPCGKIEIVGTSTEKIGHLLERIAAL